MLVGPSKPLRSQSSQFPKPKMPRNPMFEQQMKQPDPDQTILSFLRTLDEKGVWEFKQSLRADQKLGTKNLGPKVCSTPIVP